MDYSGTANKISVLRWCPGPESNQRHADFQATINPEKSSGCHSRSVKLRRADQWVTGELSNSPVADLDTETKTPTTAATGAGAYSQGFVKQPGIYQGAFNRAIVSIRVGPDLLIHSFAFAEVLA